MKPVVLIKSFGLAFLLWSLIFLLPDLIQLNRVGYIIGGLGTKIGLCSLACALLCLTVGILGRQRLKEWHL